MIGLSRLARALGVLTALTTSSALSLAQNRKGLPPTPDSLVRAAIFTFQRGWDSAWKQSSPEPVNPREIGGDRFLALHCHTELKGNFFFSDNIDRFATSKFSAFAACPTWLLGDLEETEERFHIDNALDVSFRNAIRIKRDTLVAFLDRMLATTSNRDLTLGQLVRFEVDNKQWDRALASARACGATEWWCTALEAFVLAMRGDGARAEVGYNSALAKMPQAVRCDWNDMATALDLEGDKFYTAIPCGKRDSIDARVWWLADPLFMVPGNERRLQHFVRKTLVALHSALDHDERWDWNPRNGGDARARMIYRYGWPTFVYWGGGAADANHSGYLGQHKSEPNEPYTTYEYSFERLHTIPSHHAIKAPYAAVSRHWDIADTNTTAIRTLQNAVWWPREHFDFGSMLVSLPDPQLALFRRQTSTLFAVGFDLPAAPLGRPATAQIPSVTLVFSPHPDSAFRAKAGTGIVGLPNVLSTMIPTTPTLAGVEFQAEKGVGPGGRLRFGVTPPPPLADMAAGSVAISDPVILLAPRGDEELPVETTAAIARMASSTRVAPVGKMGIYWETYGFAPTDTMELALWIERHTPQGIARSFTNKLRLTTDLNTPVAVSWTEMPGGARVHVINGPVRIVGRSVTIDVSKLAKGAYWLDVAAKTPGGQTVRGRREFTVQ